MLAWIRQEIKHWISAKIPIFRRFYHPFVYPKQLFKHDTAFYNENPETIENTRFLIIRETAFYTPGPIQIRVSPPERPPAKRLVVLFCPWQSKGLWSFQYPGILLAEAGFSWVCCTAWRESALADCEEEFYTWTKIRNLFQLILSKTCIVRGEILTKTIQTAEDQLCYNNSE